MTSHDNRDNILSDQKLHDLLKSEDEFERLLRRKRDKPAETGLLPEENADESLL
ncbi:MULTISPECIES: hypothetical protein [Rhizobium]|uniref:Uncharacterized protein n=1 Tax=Rhizobium miluonense TaxID=411945 RepID=A0A1C3WY39_9HYPH|nr:hypothetical protein [Rhizobium miluonense]SCB44908.1 hypothetical protein GA0061102_104639 [Rhizobium miluonense]